MKIKSERDFWAGMMFLVIGVAFAWGATTYSFGSSARPGPGYFPFGLGVLLALLGALELFKALISSWASDEFSWKATVGNAIVLILMSWLIFIKGLSLIIPMWPTIFGAG